jgi:multisubunit Na+/H+ antiporter MnhC subunit
MVPLSWYLIVAAILFAMGLYGVVARRNAVAILMAVELMLNAVNINLIAFWRYQTPDRPVGWPGPSLSWRWLRRKPPSAWRWSLVSTATVIRLSRTNWIR